VDGCARTDVSVLHASRTEDRQTRRAFNRPRKGLREKHPRAENYANAKRDKHRSEGSKAEEEKTASSVPDGFRRELEQMIGAHSVAPFHRAGRQKKAAEGRSKPSFDLRSNSSPRGEENSKLKGERSMGTQEQRRVAGGATSGRILSEKRS